MSLREDLRWFLAHLDTVPGRIHRRGVWADPVDGLGSVLGAPKLDGEFARWLMAGDWALVPELIEVDCYHPRMTPLLRQVGQLCPDCGVADAAGEIVAEAGRREATLLRYRWPMRSAMARLHGAPVGPGLPRLSVALMAIAHAGSLEGAGARLAGAASALAWRYPVMGDPEHAAAHFARALARVREVYREHPEALPRPARGGMPHSGYPCFGR